MHMTRKKLEYELGRYKKKVADQQKEIQQLKEQIAGYQQGQDISFAMIAAVVQQVGEVKILREDVSTILNEHRHVSVNYDEVAAAYTLRMLGGETDGEETGAENAENAC